MLNATDRNKHNNIDKTKAPRDGFHNERGSALWFILLILVLIGLLTVMLNRGSSSSEQSGNIEQQRIKISQMMRTVKGIESAIETMRMQGVSESDLNFEMNAANSANCTSSVCKLYHRDGGGIIHTAPPSGISSAANPQWIITGHNVVDGVGTSAPDLVLILTDIAGTYCTQINRILNAETANNSNAIDITPFDGSFTASQTIQAPNAQRSGCISDSSGNIFYHVLIAR